MGAGESRRGQDRAGWHPAERAGGIWGGLIPDRTGDDLPGLLQHEDGIEAALHLLAQPGALESLGPVDPRRPIPRRSTSALTLSTIDASRHRPGGITGPGATGIH